MQTLKPVAELKRNLRKKKIVSLYKHKVKINEEISVNPP
jgi:hypothetical protein